MTVLAIPGPVAAQIAPVRAQVGAAVRLLAHGRLPHRPQLRPLGPTLTESWRRFHGIAETAQLMACIFNDPADCQIAPGTHLHPVQLGQDWAMLRSRTAGLTPALLYLHRGQQPDTRCPILQDLLQVLDHRGAVHALRVETAPALRDALAIARALAQQHGLLLVLNDPTRRLCLAPRTAASLRYMLLATGPFPPRLQAAGTDLAAPSYALQTESPDVRS